MSKKSLTIEQKHLDVDLWIIFITTCVAFGIYITFQTSIMDIMRDGTVHILLRLLLAAASEFGLAGLGISITLLLRKELPTAYGLNANGVIKSIIFCSLCFVPEIIFSLVKGELTSYLPFQNCMNTNEILASGFPVNVVGMLITALVWGFFEGFNYVVLSDKINKRYPSKNKWLNWGAIFCGLMCLLIHGAIGVSLEGIIGMITMFIIVYGMLMVRYATGSAWGCVFVFMFLWNAY